MAITTRLDLRQSQTLVMTPQLQQAIKLLQMSNLELASYVDQELEQNPLLERAEGADGEGESANAAENGSTEEASDGRENGDGEATTVESAPRDAAELAGEPSMASAEPPLDTDYENQWGAPGPSDGAGPSPDSFAHWGASRGGSFDDAEFSLEQTLPDTVTLRDHLVDQLNMDLTDPVDRMIGVQLVDLLDESGYLTIDLSVAAEQLGCGVERVEATLLRLQELDPPGIFARNLKECLALQLKDRGRFDPCMAKLLDHLDLLARRDFAGLRKACEVSQEDLVEMIAEIRALDPKPGLAFDQGVAQPVTPDVLMRPHPDGGWQIELNAETLPRVLVNQPYYTRVSREAKSKPEREYISERYQSANWLVKSLHQRATTILKVASEIVRQQDAFFAYGVQHLKPLVLRDIAAAIDMHESTVSRVTTNKYMATPRGMYELKYFFTSSIASSEGGEAHSAEAVRHRIKTLVDNETSAEILSDDRIVEILRKDGVDIARRTVAKYREALKLPSSVQRRRLKSAEL
ncbi:MAG TPA: RNA polymerase factor sigma-54 [Alphaproteobacteria bacterium]|nr:RNA polymerase factor sigma-54 [Alphaproteobacteria bacterium]